MDKVYWNTGALGAKQNHWLRVSLTGLPERKLVGTRLYAYQSSNTLQQKSVEWFASAEGKKMLLGSRHLFSNHAYKSGGPLEVHFGLGKHDTVNILAVLQDGSSRLFPNINVNRQVALDVKTGEVITITPTANSVR